MRILLAHEVHEAGGADARAIEERRPHPPVLRDGRARSRPKILAVHQGYELYGSDRTFISSLAALREYYPDARLTVLLPREGDLSAELGRLGIDVEIARPWVARKADGLGRLAFKALALPLYCLRALRRMRAADITYINTSVVFDYTLASRFVRQPVLLHVHEIPTGLAMAVVRFLLTFSTAALIHNSEATRRAIAARSGQTQIVVLNGVPYQQSHEQREPFSSGPEIRILMIGRINSWKGQDLLVRAVSDLPPDMRQRVVVKCVGAAFEGGPAEAELRDLVDALGLSEQVHFEGFVPNPASLYQWADLVVVPSKKPEPFGLVAVEAMSQGRPVVAAGHGGLVEIVQHGVSGLWFTPGDAADLSRAIGQIAGDPLAARMMGEAGRAAYARHFTEEHYKHRLSQAFQQVEARP